jgi:diguanylate cyclase (GGDEF)-like protein/PAS domain S-box-containing protein
VLGGVYFVAACLATRYTRFEGGVAMIWIANALLFADLRYRPEHSWAARCIACAVGSGVATAIFGLGPHAAVPLAAINIAEAVGGALLMRRAEPVVGSLSSLREIGLFAIVVGITLPALTAFPAALAAQLVAGVPYSSTWTSWFAGHALGVLTVVPFLNLVMNGDVAGWFRQTKGLEWMEAGCLLLGMLVTSIVVFMQEHLPLLFLPFAPMMLAVFRLGRIGATVSVLIITIVGISLTLVGDGPVGLIQGGAGLKVQFFQFYVVVAMLTSLPAAAELKRRKKLYSLLQQSSALYKVIADRTGDIILATDLNGRIDYASPSIQTIGGYDPKDMRGRNARDIIYQEDIGVVSESHARAIANPDQTFKVEFRAALATGELSWFESHGRAILNEEGGVTGTVSVIREMSERKLRELDLTHAADTDPLTGLANRRSLLSLFNRSVPTAIERQQSVCLAIFDLDHFKGVNDTFGHSAGDEVIRRFANVLTAAVRGNDVVARVGGEEFAVLLIGPDLKEAHSICDRVRREFGGSLFTFASDRSTCLTVSGGLAQIVGQTMELEDAMKIADSALYLAKAQGRDRLAIAA